MKNSGAAVLFCIPGIPVWGQTFSPFLLYYAASPLNLLTVLVPDFHSACKHVTVYFS